MQPIVRTMPLQTDARHKTRSVLDQHNIGNESDVREVVRTLGGTPHKAGGDRRGAKKLVYLINPNNPVVSLSKFTRWNRLNKYRVWNPLGLLILARLTPADWQVEVIDENLCHVDYDRMPPPDLVGVTAFTSQATRAYQIAAHFRARDIPVVMGGIHASMCVDEALRYVDAVVTGEAEQQWAQLLEDAKAGTLKRLYSGGLVPTDQLLAARRDLLRGRYYFGSVQTTRGCPLRCNFCSVTAFNGGKFRHRPLETVIDELRQVEEKAILFVDDNLIGTRQDHMAYAKRLFRAMIQEGLTRPWICQATINFADDDELLQLAARAGCMGVFIGFESPTVEGLIAVHKTFNIRKGSDDQRRSVRRIQAHGMLVVGSFIMGIDTDQHGIGEVLAQACDTYGLDMASVLVLTPLPGTSLYQEMWQQDRVLARNYPDDWQYYTLSHPVARYKNLTWEELVEEMKSFNDVFYSYRKISCRVLGMAARNWRKPRTVLAGLLANLSYRQNHLLDRRVYTHRRHENPAASSPFHSSPRRSESGPDARLRARSAI